MARLKHSGSSQPLRRKLFPIGFAGEVMLIILETWLVFSLRNEVRKENRITAIFRQALIDAYVEAGRSWFITLEDPVTDPDFGSELGRNDVRFYPINHHGQTIFFTVEFKRLRVRTTSGFKHLTDKYVDDGMLRFVNGQYSAGLPCGGMVGYVMDNERSKAFASILSEIEQQKTALRLRPKDALCVPSVYVPDYEWSADSFHTRTDGIFALHHLLVGVTK